MSNKPFNTTGSPFKDSNGRWKTLSLFAEYCEPHLEPMWTLSQAKEMYLASNDPTEYTQAYEITENWDHWKRLLESSIIAAHIEDWRSELEVKLRSQAIQNMRLSDKDTAQKWLAERGWKDKRVGPGRPTKAQKAADAAADLKLKKELENMTAH